MIEINPLNLHVANGFYIISQINSSRKVSNLFQTYTKYPKIRKLRNAFLESKIPKHKLFYFTKTPLANLHIQFFNHMRVSLPGRVPPRSSQLFQAQR